MPWEDPEGLRDFHPVMAMALDRFAAAHGVAPIERFYYDCLDLGAAIQDAGDTPENPLHDDDATAVIRQYIAEMAEIEGPEVAGDFLRFYKAIIGFVTRVEKGAIARHARRSQLARVRRR